MSRFCFGTYIWWSYKNQNVQGSLMITTDVAIGPLKSLMDKNHSNNNVENYVAKKFSMNLQFYFSFIKYCICFAHVVLK